MAVVGPSRHPRGAMMQANQHAILAAAAPFYHTGPPHAHQASTPSSVGAGADGVTGPGGLDVQPDRPIGYGAFGVVW
ncbi:hypothetical protein WDU94_005866 [Cyamophila willieti]